MKIFNAYQIAFTKFVAKYREIKATTQLLKREERQSQNDRTEDEITTLYCQKPKRQLSQLVATFACSRTERKLMKEKIFWEIVLVGDNNKRKKSKRLLFVRGCTEIQNTIQYGYEQSKYKHEKYHAPGNYYSFFLRYLMLLQFNLHLFLSPAIIWFVSSSFIKSATCTLHIHSHPY